MPKAYWIVRVSVRQPERYPDYLAAARPAFEKFGAKFIVRGGPFELMEGQARDRNVVVEFTDLVFAVDSIPATFGVTTDPFLVFTSNIFAVMGLRSLYFLLAAVVDRFHLLKYGLAIILSFVGFKMLTERWIEIDIMMSLAIILGVLALSVIASLIWSKHESQQVSR